MTNRGASRRRFLPRFLGVLGVGLLACGLTVAALSGCNLVRQLVKLDKRVCLTAPAVE
ncbi:MAG: hypothetical protein ACYC5M_01355 [Anaerolineae bacterium]